MNWLYELPSIVFGGLICAVCLLYTWGGLLLTRPHIRRWLGPQPGSNDLVNYILSVCSGCYGLLLGLIAVAAYQNFVNVDRAVVREATVLGSLYRDMDGYPEPLRSNLQGQLREYVRDIIDVAWPAQRRGEIPESGTKLVSEYQRNLYKFLPSNREEEIIHGEAIREYNQFVEARRVRLHTITTGLPEVMWVVVVIGAALNFSLLWFFSLDRLSVHLMLSGMLAVFVSLMLFLIASLDNPFRGSVSVSPDAFKIIRDSLMVPDAGR